MANNEVLQHYFTCAGGQGDSPISARYQALTEAGLADHILLEVQGFLPPGSTQRPPGKIAVTTEQRLFIARIESAEAGEVISAAIAVAYPENPHHGAPVIPVAATGHKEDIEAIARSQAQSAVEQRGDTVKEIQSLAVQVRVSRPSCALACVVLTPSI